MTTVGHDAPGAWSHLNRQKLKLASLFLVLFMSCNVLFLMMMPGKTSERRTAEQHIAFKKPPPKEPHWWVVLKNASYQAPYLEDPRNTKYLVNRVNSTNRLTHIVVPFYAGQLIDVLQNFDIWDGILPCTAPQNDVSLVFFISREDYASIARRAILKRAADSPWAKECFRSVTVVSAGLSVEEDTYWLGSRLHFEHFLRLHFLSEASEVGYVMYLEPDCYFFRPGWLQLLHDEAIRDSPYYIKGHNSSGRFHVFPHINGNALYNLGDSLLARFYFYVYGQFLFADPEHEEKALRVIHHAYDMDIAHFLSIHHELPLLLEIWQGLKSSDFIQNFFQREFNISEIAEEYPMAFITHGGYMT